MSEVLSLLSLLRGALLRTWHATSPCQWHLGILIHTRAPFSTPGRPPPHQGALLHTRAPSSIPGCSTQHQGSLLHIMAPYSTPGALHQDALLHSRALSSVPQVPSSVPEALSSVPEALCSATGALSSNLLTKVSSSIPWDVLVTRGLTTALPFSISGQPSPHQRTPHP